VTATFGLAAGRDDAGGEGALGSVTAEKLDPAAPLVSLSVAAFADTARA
jgi:hypothetical protein